MTFCSVRHRTNRLAKFSHFWHKASLGASVLQKGALLPQNVFCGFGATSNGKSHSISQFVPANVYFMADLADVGTQDDRKIAYGCYSMCLDIVRCLATAQLIYFQDFMY